MIISLIRLRQRELLNHAINIVQFCEIDRLFTIEGLAGWPAVDGASVCDHGEGVYFDFTNCWRGGGGSVSDLP